MGKVNAPEALTDQHDKESFDCGDHTLNDWLKKRALKNHTLGASRTFVICENNSILGFYALSSGCVERLTVPKPMTRNMPNTIPVVVLGRLAVSKEYQSQRLGAALLRDAMLRTLAISRQVGVKALLVHAISDSARCFYEKYGFQSSPMDPMTLFLPLKTIQACQPLPDLQQDG